MSLNWKKLREEMKSLIIQIRASKSKTRDKHYNVPSKRKEYWQAKAEWWSASARFTRLCVLRSIITRKQHFSPNTDVKNFWPRPKSLDEADLKEWVKPEMAEFMVSE
tara:strand:+ start:124215 stop:124535 length:321 start_codon:yes stop_codon:yes gene_type:complete